MNKLVCGVGVNDLGYRTQAYEEVTKNGGKRIQKSVFICKYYAACQWFVRLGMQRVNGLCVHDQFRRKVIVYC